MSGIDFTLGPLARLMDAMPDRGTARVTLADQRRSNGVAFEARSVRHDFEALLTALRAAEVKLEAVKELAAWFDGTNESGWQGPEIANRIGNALDADPDEYGCACGGCAHREAGL